MLHYLLFRHFINVCGEPAGRIERDTPQCVKPQLSLLCHIICQSLIRRDMALGKLRGLELWVSTGSCRRHGKHIPVLCKPAHTISVIRGTMGQMAPS